MKIVVIGGTGIIGSRLVEKLRMLNHAVIAASPQTGINTITGEGLDEALKNTDVVVDVSNAPSFEDDKAMDFFRTSTLSLLAAEIDAGVKHHIALSVVGADRLPDSGYMRAKVEQESLIKQSGVSYTILRSTQFFELAGRIADISTINNQVHISQVAIQPIAADDVVDALKDITLSVPKNGTIEIGGPVCMPMYELIRYYLNENEDPRQLVDDEHALYFGTELAFDSLIPAFEARMGNIKYEDWFHRQMLEQ